MKTKIASLALLLTLIFPIMAKSQVKIQQTAGRDALGEFAPEFARLNDDILFGEVWSRNNLLSLRDRSIVTVVALMSQGLTDSSFKYHLESAKKNGVTRTEIAEILPMPHSTRAGRKRGRLSVWQKRFGPAVMQTAWRQVRSKPTRKLSFSPWGNPTMPMPSISSVKVTRLPW